VCPNESGVNVEAVMQSLRQILGEAAPGSSTVPGNDTALAQLRAMVRNMAADGVRREDPMREVFARIGDKWSTLLLLLLRTGSYRHAVLRRLVSAVGSEGRISQRMLTLRLRALERDGLIKRRVISTLPPGVEYGLSELGAGLVQQLDVMMQWLRTHIAEIRLARQEFEAADARGIDGTMDADADTDEVEDEERG
jgi:DNA-binding HxlR family transcriptional regulator